MSPFDCQFLVADDHELVRCAIRCALESVPGWTVSAEACDGEEAVLLARGSAPGIAVIDLDMPVKNGLDAIQQIKAASPETAIVAITGSDWDRSRERAEQAGADAFLVKTQPVSDLIAIIDQLLVQRTARAKQDLPAAAAALAPLTEREREVVTLIAQGRSTPEIGALLGISRHTARTHRMNLMRKLGIGSLAELVVYAIRTGLVPDPARRSVREFEQAPRPRERRA